MKSFDLQEIYTMLKEVDGKRYTVGIKFIFHGEIEPINYGKLAGTGFYKALFKNSEQISTIKCSDEFTVEDRKFRKITFLGKDGIETEGWKN